MKLALGHNPLQSTLIDSATMPIFGEAVTPQDAEAITAQQDQVEAIMHDGYWHTLPEIVKELRRKYGRVCGEASVSARIRAMRKRGFTVNRERTRAGSNLYQYRAVKVEMASVTVNVTFPNGTYHVEPEAAL